MISIDPGTRNLGWARWDGPILVAAGASRLRQIEHLHAAAEAHVRAIGRGRDGMAVVECMTYRRDDARSQPQDLLDVQAVGCLVAAALAPDWTLLPSSVWKGTIPKDVHHPRILRSLAASERIVAEAAAAKAGASAKEVLDAIGIGLYHLRRTNRSGDPRR